MSNYSVCGTLTGSNSMEQEMLENFRAIDPDGQDHVLHIVSARRKNIERMMKETGLSRDEAFAGYQEWLHAKVEEMLNS
jgi:hypothetical protein